MQENLRGGIVCAAVGCINRQRNCNLSFFRFPKDIHLAGRWATACGREDLKEREDLYNLRLCAAHFEDSMFRSSLRNRLHRDVTPNLFQHLEGSSSSHGEQSKNKQQNFFSESTSMLHSVDDSMKENMAPLSIDINTENETATGDLWSPSSFCKTSPILISPRSTPREITQLWEQVENYPQNTTSQQFQQVTYKICPKEFAAFINMQVLQIQKKPRGRRYSNEFKKFALTMYFMGPNIYKQILSNIFGLPSPRTLLQFIQHIDFKTGVNVAIFETLQMKIQRFQDIDKLCIICMDEISIKPNLFYNSSKDTVIGLEDIEGRRSLKPALIATVVMVKGLAAHWKQPLAYHFVNSTCLLTLVDILFETIRKLHEIGLKVCGLVSNMGSNNMELAQIFDISPRKPYFIVEDQKIVFMFDTPHLLKATRNNLLKYNFIFDNKIASWNHITMFYEDDTKNTIRAAPKLSDSHISPNKFEKKNVKYASQLFSFSVAAALNTYLRFKRLPPQAIGTCEFIEKMNNLFDILNSSPKSSAKQFGQRFEGLQWQIDFLQNCSMFFKNMKVVNVNNHIITKVKCFECWQVTINGVLLLWDIVKSNGLQFLYTRKVNQDTLENLFETIRQQSGNCVKPTPVLFKNSFKKLLCLDLLHSGSQNCEEDNSQILLKIADMPQEKYLIENVPTTQLPVIDTDYRNIETLQQNFVKHICGYIIKKCLRIHYCDICVAYASEYEELDDKSLYYYFKAYNNNFDYLDKMPYNFVHYISKMEMIFQRFFELLIVRDNFIQYFIVYCKNINFIHPCTNFPYDNAIRLYGRVRLFFTLKYINRNFKRPNQDQKLIVWRNN